jgi:predicted phosphodiesterase
MPWQHVEFSGAHTVLGIYDAHIPYHDEAVLKLIIQAGQRAECDMVLLGGDFADCFALSKWEPDPRHRDFPAEIRAVKDGLKMVRNAFPKARIVWQLGNHEDRFERYMQHKCPELLGVDQFTYSEIYHTEEYGVELVGEKRPILLGKLHLIHGHEYSFPISNPVNPARGLFLRAKTHAVCGHFHQTSQHSEKRLDDKVVSCWSIGCACQLHPRYRPMNNWNHGFAIFRTDKTGAFDVESRKIIDGKVY